MIKTLSNNMLHEIFNKAEKLFGSDLLSAILYGSYARGDNDDESDVDIALIVNKNRDQLNEYNMKIARIMTDLSLEYEVLVSFSLIPIDEFNQYKSVLPYYMNIENEGIKIGA